MTITPTIAAVGEQSQMITWPNMRSGAANLVGDSVSLPDYTDMTMQVFGTFDTGTLTMQGSMDNVNWFSLTDGQGNAIAKTSATGEVIEESPLWFRAILSGAGNDVVTVMVKATRGTGWRR